MAEERIDIIVNDKVSTGPAKKLRELATQAASADSALDRLRASISLLSDTGLNKLTTASSRLTNAQAREVNATARLMNAQSRVVAQTTKTAQATQRLATEQAKTEVATERSAAAATRARTALLAEESASVRLAAAKLREASAQERAANAAQKASRSSIKSATRAGLAAHQTQNLIYQVNDVAVSLASGQRPLTVLLQQGSQISTVFGPGTGLTTIMRGLGSAIFSMAKQFLPLLVVTGLATAGFASMTYEIRKATDKSALADLQKEVNGLTKAQQENITVAITMGDVFKSTFQLAAEGVYSFLEPAISGITPIFVAAYNGVLFVTKGMINGVVGLMVFGYKATVVAWSQLTNAFTNIGTLATNALIDIVELGVNGVISIVQKMLDFVGSAFEYVGRENPFTNLTGEIDLGDYKIKGELAGTNFVDGIKGAAAEAFTVDFAGDAFAAIRKRSVENARKRIRKEIDEETGTASKSKRNLIRETNDATAALIAEEKALRGTIGVYNDYGRAVASATKYAKLVGAAHKARIALSPQLLAGLKAEAEAFGSATASLNRTKLLKSTIESIIAPITEYRQAQDLLNDALKMGYINAAQLNAALATTKLVTSLADVDKSLIGTPFAEDAAMDEIRNAEQARLNVVQQALDARIISEQDAAERIVAINRQAAIDTRQAHVASQSVILLGASDTFASMADAAKGFAGEQSAAYRVLFAASKAFAIADSIIKIQQGVASALSLPFPANIAAFAGVAAQGASIVSSIQAVAGTGFKDGGSTGNGGVNEVAGLVHGQEFVFNAAATRRIGVGNLERMQAGGEAPTRAFRQDNSVNLGINVSIENYGASKDFEVRPISETEVVIIARDVARDVVRRDTAGIVSGEMSNPNSKVSRALTQNTNAQRRR